MDRRNGTPASRPPQRRSPAPYGGTRPGSAPGRYTAQPARRSAPQSHRKPPQRRKKGNSVPPFLSILCVALVALLAIGITIKITSSLTKDRTASIITLTPSSDPGQQVATTQGTPEPASQPQSQDPATSAPEVTATPEPTAEPAWIQPEDQPSTVPSGSLRSATIRTVGDIIMHDPLLETAAFNKSAKNYKMDAENYNFDNYFAYIGATMMRADWTVANIEATLRCGKYGFAGYPQFSTPVTILNTLRSCGVDMLTMCNNHMLDGYWDGLRESINAVEAVGMKHVGAFRTQEEYDTPEIIEINGIRVGFLNYTQTTNTMETKSDKAASQYGFRNIKDVNFDQQVSALRNAGAEVVVAYMHWGEEYNRMPESSTKKYAQKLVAAGVDIIVGGHPHVVQPCEYVSATKADGTVNTALVVYSLGNFISDQRIQYRDSGIIFDFTIQENSDGSFSIVNPCYIPVYVWRWGSESQGYDYRILSIGEFMNDPPDGMSDKEYERMKNCWYEIYNQMGGDAIATAIIG